jgi:imidazoleglycerol phosphate synthase glutamine amidotransferase subunit HisH
MTIAAEYADFGTREARGISPAYERLSLAISRDDELVDRARPHPPAHVVRRRRRDLAGADNVIRPGHGHFGEGARILRRSTFQHTSHRRR